MIGAFCQILSSFPTKKLICLKYIYFILIKVKIY